MLVWPQVKPWVTRLATGELSLHRCEPIKATGRQGGASAPHFEVQQDSCSPGVIGDEICALRIAEFFDRSEATKTFKRGMDAHNNPGFYRQLGKDPDLLLRAALELRARKSRRAGVIAKIDPREVQGVGCVHVRLHRRSDWTCSAGGGV
jgi:hypothetical protein